MAAFPSGRLFRERSRVHPFGEMSQVSVFNNMLTNVNMFFFLAAVALKLLSSCDALASLVVACRLSCPVRHMGSWFPDQGLNLCPLHWKVDS